MWLFFILVISKIIIILYMKYLDNFGFYPESRQRKLEAVNKALNFMVWLLVIVSVTFTYYVRG